MTHTSSQKQQEQQEQHRPHKLIARLYKKLSNGTYSQTYTELVGMNRIASYEKRAKLFLLAGTEYKIEFYKTSVETGAILEKEATKIYNNPSK